MSTPFLQLYDIISPFFNIIVLSLHSMYRRSPAESDHLPYYPHITVICQARSDLFIFSFCFLSLRKCCTGSFLAVTGAAALDIHMIRHALVIAVIDTLHCLAIDADGLTGMGQGTGKGIPSLSLLRKALTAGAVTVTGMLAAHHDVSLTAQTVLIIGTIFHNTF